MGPWGNFIETSSKHRIARTRVAICRLHGRYLSIIAMIEELRWNLHRRLLYQAAGSATVSSFQLFAVSPKWTQPWRTAIPTFTRVRHLTRKWVRETRSSWRSVIMFRLDNRLLKRLWARIYCREIARALPGLSGDRIGETRIALCHFVVTHYTFITYLSNRCPGYKGMEEVQIYRRGRKLAILRPEGANIKRRGNYIPPEKNRCANSQ